MKEEYSRNYNNYGGESLMLNSGAEFDEVLFQYTMSLRSQAPLHSFILESDDFSKIVGLFPSDQEELAHLFERMKSSDTGNAYSLEDWKVEVINHYKNAYPVDDVVFKGWDNVFRLEGPEPQGYQDFVKMAVTFMNDILENYKEYGQELVGKRLNFPKCYQRRLT
ncbi:hypothetical protein BGX27_002375 [Mortierella sp. AM989]|nr:hypothetical protein BGX27_002375 [Mortierella sp. AM989]